LSTLFVACLGDYPGCVGRLRRVSGGLQHENRILEPVIEPPAGGFDACGARVLTGRTADVARRTRIHSSPLWRRRTRWWGESRVSFADFDRRLFRAPHSALCAPQRVEHSDQIEGKEATCGELSAYVAPAPLLLPQVYPLPASSATGFNILRHWPHVLPWSRSPPTPSTSE